MHINVIIYFITSHKDNSSDCGCSHSRHNMGCNRARACSGLSNNAQSSPTTAASPTKAITTACTQAVGTVVAHETAAATVLMLMYSACTW
jgi:hypothetical protein